MFNVHALAYSLVSVINNNYISDVYYSSKIGGFANDINQNIQLHWVSSVSHTNISTQWYLSNMNNSLFAKMVEAISPLLNHTLTATARTMTTTTTTSSSSSSSTPTLTTVDNESVSNDQLSQLLFLPLETSNYLSNVTHLYPSNLDQYLSLSNVSNLTSNDGENELYSFSTNIYNLDESISTSTITTNTSPNVIPTIVLEPDLRIHHPILAIILGLICVVVVFGNVLTMVSIYKERYLHTVTNYFVASLAAADCLVGAIVMPFSVVHEVMNKWWIFGQDWYVIVNIIIVYLRMCIPL